MTSVVSQGSTMSRSGEIFGFAANAKLDRSAQHKNWSGIFFMVIVFISLEV
jgi:hypothetical protein